jgi:hypothetical protein
VKGCSIRRRWKDRDSEVCSVGETGPHFAEKEVLIGFGLDVPAVFGKVEAEGGIAGGTFSTNGNLRGESVSIWLVPMVEFAGVAISVIGLVDGDERIIEPP